jgi:hypothetical protein
VSRLTEQQAYDAMFRFLDTYWERTGRPDELGALLGSMSREIWTDHEPADPAMWEDWVDAVKYVTKT